MRGGTSCKAGNELSDEEVLAAMCRAALAHGPDTGTSAGQPPYQLFVTVCEQCERGWQEGAGELVEVGPAIVAQASCDADVIRRTADGRSSKSRTIPKSVYRLVMRRDHHRCIVPGCRNSEHLEVHHLVHRAWGGDNHPDNLAVLCAGHHAALHDGRLVIRGKPGAFRFEHDDGRAWGTPPPEPLPKANPRPSSASVDALRLGLRGLWHQGPRHHGGDPACCDTRESRRAARGLVPRGSPPVPEYPRHMRAFVVVVVLAALGGVARAQDALTITEVRVDRPTLHALGVQVLISGDDDRDAAIAVRVRPEGGELVDGPPLFRVKPETVTGRVVPEQFAGSVFDLAPGTSYELELTATDPDGGGETRMVSAATRAVPRRDPETPRAVAVGDADELRAALAAAQPGDVITLAGGTYAGSFFTLNASGTAENPIVIRGEGPTTFLDGEGCTGCNILEVYGSHVHVEALVIRNGERGLRFQGDGTTGNVVRWVQIENVVHGIGAGTNQTDFTICDNAVFGRLAWPLVYSDDGAIHADDQGIRVAGAGHVVCHNNISGFGDPLINSDEGARSYDFHGNDIHEIYGDGTELDRGEGNVRFWGNRMTNLFTAISIQPVHGGPTYVVRNVVVNVADEQVKLKSLGGTEEPSGALIYHNTFVSPDLALNLQTPITQHNSRIVGNLFVGPSPTAGGRTVDWTAALDDVLFDGNGYYPDEGYWFGTVGSPRVYADLAEAQADGVETAGRVLELPIFDDALAAPATYTELVERQVPTLDATSNAVDVALPLTGINANHLGDGPDLGALERGCPSPTYGPRQIFGPQDTTNAVDCTVGAPVDGDDLGPRDGTPIDTGSEPGGCCRGSPDGAALPLILLALASLVVKLTRSSRWRGSSTDR